MHSNIAGIFELCLEKEELFFVYIRCCQIGAIDTDIRSSVALSLMNKSKMLKHFEYLYILDITVQIQDNYYLLLNMYYLDNMCFIYHQYYFKS